MPTFLRRFSWDGRFTKAEFYYFHNNNKVLLEIQFVCFLIIKKIPFLNETKIGLIGYVGAIRKPNEYFKNIYSQ